MGNEIPDTRPTDVRQERRSKPTRLAVNIIATTAASFILALVIGGINSRDTIRTLDLTVEIQAKNIADNEREIRACLTSLQQVREQVIRLETNNK